ncbi:putative multidrug resistance protein [Symbiodinium microadriaticum]|uniref:Putative multidrug resistance protein n=1 Tax=Symbiodinium microadriaticum TaxID=2951 RepID=A0A1Q9CQ93_SYMMI|nr:putative multidrug resistance protein [Symbiodinium microadriaticum]
MYPIYPLRVELEVAERQPSSLKGFPFNRIGEELEDSLVLSIGWCIVIQQEDSFLAGVTLPSDEIAEIPQKLYCPLFTEPMAWMFGHHSLKAMRAEDLESLESQVQHFLAELDFRPSASAADIPIDLRAVKDDWYGKLSGGQRSKAELVRQIFLQKQCPQILLIDEALGPLDAQSKVLVQRKLKAFCNQSLILAIHHLDAHTHCVAPGGFFDDNLHFGKGEASVVGTCEVPKTE